MIRSCLQRQVKRALCRTEGAKYFRELLQIRDVPPSIQQAILSGWQGIVPISGVSSSVLPHYLSDVELIPPRERLHLEMEFQDVNNWAIDQLRNSVLVADSDISNGGVVGKVQTLASMQDSRMFILLLSILTSEHQTTVLAQLIGSGLVGLLQTVIRLTGPMSGDQTQENSNNTLESNAHDGTSVATNSTTAEIPVGADLVPLLTVGTRVVKGADWKWGDQDGPAPSEGTVVDEIGPDGWVRIQWDTGSTNSYRMGKEGKYDLTLAKRYSMATSHMSRDRQDDTPAVGSGISLISSEPDRLIRTGVICLLQSLAVAVGLNSDFLANATIQGVCNLLKMLISTAVGPPDVDVCRNPSLLVSMQQHKSWATLGFVRGIAVSDSIRRNLSSSQWTELLLSIVAGRNLIPGSTGTHHYVPELEQQVLALRLLRAVLPGLDTAARETNLVENLFVLLGDILVQCQLANSEEVASDVGNRSKQRKRKVHVSPTASAISTVAEELVALIRRLHRVDSWRQSINMYITSQLGSVRAMMSIVDTSGSQDIAKKQAAVLAVLSVIGGVDGRARLGGQVEHEDFGIGTISKISSTDAQLTVYFEGQKGPKICSLAHVKPVDGEQFCIQLLLSSPQLTDMWIDLINLATGDMGMRWTTSSRSLQNVPTENSGTIANVDMLLLRQQQIFLSLLRAARVLLSQQDSLRYILSKSTEQTSLFQQVLHAATLPSPVKAIFSRDEIETAVVTCVQYLVAATSKSPPRVAARSTPQAKIKKRRPPKQSAEPPPPSQLVSQIMDMGFPRRTVEYAISCLGGSESAETVILWLLEHPDVAPPVLAETQESEDSDSDLFELPCLSEDEMEHDGPATKYRTRSEFMTTEEYARYVRDTIKVGMTVRCREAYEEVEEGDFGRVVKLDNDGLHDLNVQADWRRKGGYYWVRYSHVEMEGFPSKTEAQALTSGGGQLKIGSRVRVKPEIRTPKYKWGSVTPGSIGLVAQFCSNGTDVKINYPEQTNWTAVIAEMELVPAIHENFTCDSCKSSPISGVRFHCSECANYDLCQTCFQKPANASHEHNFLAFEEPNSSPKSAGKAGRRRHGRRRLPHGTVLREWSKCVKNLHVSSRENQAARLVDNNPDTCWQSSGSQGKHWIRLELFSDILVQELTMHVEPSDSSYQPSMVTIAVGQSLAAAKELHTVHIAPTDTKVLLLQNLTSEQRFVQINIKACKSGGIDCKVRNLNIVGLVKADEDELAASFQYLAVDDLITDEDDHAVEVKGSRKGLSRDDLGQSRRRDRRLAGERVTVFVWGLNDKDQLGGLRGSKIRSPTLSDVLSRLNVVQLAGGSKCLIAVTRDGKVYCCGENVSGRLGLSHSNNVHSVQQIQSLSQYVVKKVAIHSSGRHTLALTADGKVFSWGEGADGKLGHGNRVTLETPRLIEALKAKRVRDVACGSSHSAAITSNGELYTWGLGEYGRLGHGDTTTQTRPKQVKGLAGYRVIQVACGSRDAQTLAITDDGNVWSWGDGDFGKLGRGGSEGTLQPEKIDCLVGIDICQVECGAQFSLVLTREGVVYTWGKGDYYRLGHGTDIHVRKPQPIESLKGVKVVHVAVGALHCVAVTDQGKVYSWGDNDHGQLGSGSTTVSKKPSIISVLDSFRIARVACGSSHTFAWTKPIETVPSVEHQPVMFLSRFDPIGTTAVLQSSRSPNVRELLSPSDIILKHRPTLSKIVLSLPDNPRRQDAIQPLLQALQISYARAAVVSGLAGDMALSPETTSENALATSMSPGHDGVSDLASIDTLAVDSLGSALCLSTSDVVKIEERNVDADSSSMDDFILLLTEGDGRLLLDLLKLAVSGRVSETGRIALSHTVKMLGKTKAEVAEMLLELCITELEDVAACTEASPFAAQPVVQESPHPYADNCSLTGIVRIPGAESLRVEFERQCSTERRHDPLIIADAAGRVQATRSGREWSDWASELIIQGDELRWRFSSDNSVNGWGWKFTVYPVTATKEALDTLPDRVIQSRPSVDLVSCLLDFRLESSSPFDVVPRLASALGACARLSGLEPSQRLWALQRLRKLLGSKACDRVDVEAALKGGTKASESGPLTVALSSLIKGMPNMLLKQYAYEEGVLRQGKQLIYTSFFKGLVALAADLGLDSSSSCQDNATWKWLKRYCSAFRIASSIIRRSVLPKDFVEEVRVKLQALMALAEMPNYDHEDHSLFRKEHDEQLMAWLQRKPDDWTLSSKGSSVLYGWGHNHRGQLGGIDGSKVKTPTVLESIAALRPIQIIGGEQTLFIVTRDGKVYATGYGAYGRLGIGGTDSVSSPRLIESFQDVAIKKVAVHSGGKHCLALSVAGAVYSWGEGDDGKLGHGNRSNCEVPRLIEALKDKVVVDIACGGSHSSCILENGDLYTWGKGRYGRLGHGDSDEQTKPKHVQAFHGMRVVSVACGSGDAQTLAVSDDGQVWSWGDGDYGKLGRGGSDGCKVPKPVTDLAGKGVIKVECGSQFSVALTKSGEVYTWGKGDYHRLGHSLDGHQRNPKLVEALKGKIVTSVMTGSLHCCCCTADGEVFTWGDNDEGQLGSSSTEGIHTPMLVSSLKGKFIDRIASGSAHTVAWSTTQPSSACRLPREVPMEYNHLRDIEVKVLRNRLVLLNHFSDLVSTCIGMFGLAKQNISAAADSEVNFDELRGLLSSAVKESVFKKVVQNTMVRDRPHGPIIEVNRLQVKRSRLRSGLTGTEGTRSVFGQICSRMVTAGPDSLFLPQRVWKVKFIGESVDDCGGGYSESISEMCDELHTGIAPLLIPTPNGREETGVNQDCYIFNPQARSPQHINMFRFLGILCGIAVRTGHFLSISLAPPVWKQLAGVRLAVGDLVEIDKEFVPSLVYIRSSSREDLEALDLPFTTPSATGGEVQLSTKYKRVTPRNREEYVQMALRYRCHEFDAQVAAVREGIAKVVPVPLLSLFNGPELETMVCGNPEINVDVLKSIATYKGISASSQLVRWFWQTLENFTVAERSLFLRFVWGRTRLPRTVADFKGRDFVVQVMEKHGRPDEYLPEAYTCFFLLKLPRYSLQEILHEKLKYAIYFCKSIDTDDYARVNLTIDAEQDDSDLEDEAVTE